MMSFEISSDVLGRPGVRQALPSYFCAINLRCHASKVSGVTIVATWARTLRPSRLALATSRRRWLSVIGTDAYRCARAEFDFPQRGTRSLAAASDSASPQRKQRETKMDPDPLASREVIMWQEISRVVRHRSSFRTIPGHASKPADRVHSGQRRQASRHRDGTICRYG